MFRIPSSRHHFPHLSVVSALALFLGMVGSAGAVATAPTLGAAASFAVLGGQSVTNTGPTGIYGDLGVSPGSSITGFPPGTVHGTIHQTDVTASNAQAANTTAYGLLAAETCDTNLTGQDLGGLTLTPAVYCFSSSAGLTGNLTLNGQGNANAVFVFNIVSTLISHSGSSVTLTNSASPCNVFWRVGSSATLGTTTLFAGNILALASITLNTRARLDGRALASTGSVTMDNNIVSNVGCPGATGQVAPPAGLPPPAAPAQVPEGDSLVLVVTGLAGLAGYAGLRWHARRAPMS